jgi:hypothetical protein
MSLAAALAAYRAADAAYALSTPLAPDHIEKCEALLRADSQLYEACIALGMRAGDFAEQFARRALCATGGN